MKYSILKQYHQLSYEEFSYHVDYSCLLFGSILVITHWLAEGKDLNSQPGYVFAQSPAGAKKRVMIILNAKKEMFSYAHRVTGYTVVAVAEMQGFTVSTVPDTLAARGLVKLDRAVGIMRKVIDHTELRVIRKEKVLASE